MCRPAHLDVDLGDGETEEAESGGEAVVAAGGAGEEDNDVARQPSKADGRSVMAVMRLCGCRDMRLCGCGDMRLYGGVAGGLDMRVVGGWRSA